jgi:hypothetical protein
MVGWTTICLTPCGAAVWSTNPKARRRLRRTPGSPDGTDTRLSGFFMRGAPQMRKTGARKQRQYEFRAKLHEKVRKLVADNPNLTTAQATRQAIQEMKGWYN